MVGKEGVEPQSINRDPQAEEQHSAFRSTTSHIVYKKMEYILDLQGFVRSSNIFILKEAALVPVHADAIPTAFYFKPPCKWTKLLEEEQKKNLWLQNCYHGIPWNSDAIEYRDLVKVLQIALCNATKVFVKGLQKKQCLEDKVPGKTIVNLEDVRCPSLKKMKTEVFHCYYHTLTRDPTCAVRNALMLKNWLLSVRTQCQFLQQQEGQDEVDVNRGRNAPPGLIHVRDKKFEEEILYSMYS